MSFMDNIGAAPAVWRRGDRDGKGETAIADIQLKLTAAGYPLVDDGDFGPATERAVRRFQSAANLVPDGIVGPKTLAALDDVDTSRLLHRTDIERAARELGVNVAAVLAVNEVESRGNGFLASGLPVILFERHIMRRQMLAAKIPVEPWATRLPNIVNTATGGYQGGAREHARLDQAKQIDPACAVASASWGLFQIMGFHHRLLGYATPQDMEAAASRSEGVQLDMFVRFIKADPAMHGALRRLDWTDFARRYNGPAFARNQYDTRMAQAYTRHAAGLAAAA